VLAGALRTAITARDRLVAVLENPLSMSAGYQVPGIPSRASLSQIIGSALQLHGLANVARGPLPREKSRRKPDRAWLL
jgi:hypothetical protein